MILTILSALIVMQNVMCMSVMMVLDIIIVLIVANIMMKMETKFV